MSTGWVGKPLSWRNKLIRQFISIYQFKGGLTFTREDRRKILSGWAITGVKYTFACRSMLNIYFLHISFYPDTTSPLMTSHVSLMPVIIKSKWQHIFLNFVLEEKVKCLGNWRSFWQSFPRKYIQAAFTSRITTKLSRF